MVVSVFVGCGNIVKNGDVPVLSSGFEKATGDNLVKNNKAKRTVIEKEFINMLSTVNSVDDTSCVFLYEDYLAILRKVTRLL